MGQERMSESDERVLLPVGEAECSRALVGWVSTPVNLCVV